MNILQVPKLVKSYAEIKVLDIHEFALGQGIFWLQGDNGAGKSTLLKSIAGIIPFEGDSLITGTSIKKSPVDYRSKITYCMAEPEFPDFLTQKELLHFVAKTRDSSLKKIFELQNMLGTQTYENQPVRTYSSGMLKKLGLLLAFLGTPEIILLDEPFTALDVDSVGNMISLINNFRQKYNTNFIVTSHLDSEHYHLDFDSVLKLINGQINIVR